jgi:hypothetical protein
MIKNNLICIGLAILTTGLAARAEGSYNSHNGDSEGFEQADIARATVNAATNATWRSKDRSCLNTNTAPTKPK